MVDADDFVALDGGVFRMGSERFYPEEAPVVEVEVAPFALARTAVTNRRFAEFVDATGYLTVAERDLDPAEFPGSQLDDLRGGSLVFTPTPGPVDLRDWRQWWRWVPAASWRHPGGPGTDLAGREDHPVVHIAYPDAAVFADWAGARLPTEAEWEFAARGGLDGATFAWGEEPNQRADPFANSWQGRFPYDNTGARGWVGTAPVGSFPPNGYGPHEMTGNTWEWTADLWTDDHAARRSATVGSRHAVHGHGGDDHHDEGHRGRHEGDRAVSCSCGPSATCACGPGAGARPTSRPDPRMRRVTKGGSHLCAPEYCLRYRPAARSPQTEDSATTHLGFRLARDL